MRFHDWRNTAHCELGQSRILVGQLGSKWRRRIRRHSSQRERSIARADSALSRTHGACVRYRLVRRMGNTRWAVAANRIAQEPFQRQCNSVRFRRWQGVHLAGPERLHALYGCRHASRCFPRQQVDRPFQVRRQLGGEAARNAITQG
jgi:hypothetical protein